MSESDATRTPASKRCSFCGGALSFTVFIPSASSEQQGHRVYRCEACKRVEVAFQPGTK